MSATTERATFAAGCFWDVEAAFRAVPGVRATAVGYCGGHTAEPTYEQVCAGGTGHAEAVTVEFDPAAISYVELLEVFWQCHAAASTARPGPGGASQYRSVVFCHSPEQRQAALRSRNEVGATPRAGGPEILPAETFHFAEEEHQQYLEKQHLGLKQDLLAR